MKEIEVRKSSIEGRGVFALRDFKKGERVLDWRVRKVLPEDELERLSQDERRRYVSFVNGKYLLSGEPARYVNHSCDANTKADNNGDVAVRDIVAGEEITSDYSSYGSENIPCRCSTPNCRGTF